MLWKTIWKNTLEQHRNTLHQTYCLIAFFLSKKRKAIKTILAIKINNSRNKGKLEEAL